MAESDSRYQQMRFAVRVSASKLHGTVALDVCNSCGSIVGNRPAHDVLCATDGVPAFTAPSAPEGRHEWEPAPGGGWNCGALAADPRWPNERCGVIWSDRTRHYQEGENPDA